MMNLLETARLVPITPKFGTFNLAIRTFGKKHAPTFRDRWYFPGKHDPKQIAKTLRSVETQLIEPEQEPYGMYRGRDIIYHRLKKSATNRLKRKQVNRRVAMKQLVTLIYVRHALRHGARKLKEFDPLAMGKTFLGNTNVNIPYNCARLILLELWRYGRSAYLTYFQGKHEKYLRRQKRLQENTTANKQKRKRVLRELEMARQEAERIQLEKDMEAAQVETELSRMYNSKNILKEATNRMKWLDDIVQNEMPGIQQ
jgi:hypothetical protein